MARYELLVEVLMERLPGVSFAWSWEGMKMCWKEVLLHYVLMRCGDIFYFIFSLFFIENDAKYWL